LIAAGTGEDPVAEGHLSTPARSARTENRRIAARKIVDYVLAVDDPKAVALGLKALMPLIPLDPRLEKVLDQRILALIGRGMAAKSAELAETIALFLHRSAQERASLAKPYIPTLLSFLEQNIETTGAYAYYALLRVAKDSPGDFGPHAALLIRTLNSPSPAASTFAMRIIATLAPAHPEYVVGARDILRNLAETSPPGIIKEEATNAYHAVREVSKSPGVRSSKLLDDPAIASLYELPVWQRAVESHLTTAYSGDAADIARPHGRHKNITRETRPSKRSNLYQEFVEKLKQGEGVQSFEEQLDLLSPEAIAAATPCEIEPAGPITPAPLPPAEMSPPAIEVPVVTASPAAEDVTDSPDAALLQEMISDVQSEFSSKAGSLLDSLGMGHLKRGNAGKAEDGNLKNSAREFVSSMEKLIREHKSKAS
jgi:hypothetical protein